MARVALGVRAPPKGGAWGLLLHNPMVINQMTSVSTSQPNTHGTLTRPQPRMHERVFCRRREADTESPRAYARALLGALGMAAPRRAGVSTADRNYLPSLVFCVVRSVAARPLRARRSLLFPTRPPCVSSVLGYGQQSPRVPVAPSRLASRERSAQACDEPLSQVLTKLHETRDERLCTPWKPMDHWGVNTRHTLHRNRGIEDLRTQRTRRTTFVCWSGGVPECMQGARLCDLPRWGLTTVLRPRPWAHRGAVKTAVLGSF